MGKKDTVPILILCWSMEFIVLCGSTKHDTGQVLAGGCVARQLMSGVTPAAPRKSRIEDSEKQAWLHLLG